MAVKGTVLLGFYLVIPLCFVLLVFDAVYLGWHLRDTVLPKNPDSLLLWHLLFVFPHIFSSVITLADKEYLAFYKHLFSRALLVIALVVLFFNFIVPLLFVDATRMAMNLAFFVIFAFATMYHVLSQQLGISMSLMKLKTAGVDYELWRWANALAGTFLYFLAFAAADLKAVQWHGGDLYGLFSNSALFLIVLATIQGVRLVLRANTRVGAFYAVANIVMLTSIYIMVELNYSFFAIVIPRVIHDVTAFAVYSVHDRNRNLTVRHNGFYRLLGFLRLSPVILCVLLAITVSQLVQCGSFYLDAWLGFRPVSACLGQIVWQPEIKNAMRYPSMQFWLQISLIVAFFHYYAEAVIWKKESLHRRYVMFS